MTLSSIPGRRRLLRLGSHAGLAVLIGSVLAVGLHCDSWIRGGETRVLVYNRTLAGFSMKSVEVPVGHSKPVHIGHSEVERLPLTRNGQNLGTLVITSLVATSNPAGYDAAVNVHEDWSAQGLTLVEHSPYIDASLELGQ